MKTNRTASYPIESLILNRWSPRAMSGESLSHDELMTVFEAARWAPSSYNNQPWRFIYAHRDTPAWDQLYDLLVPFNQSWTKTAGVLVVIISSKIFEFNGKPTRTHSFDTGAATENLALQAYAMGLVCHGMEGFDYEKVQNVCNIPDNYAVEAMFALGKPAPKETLPEDLQKREEPSGRKPLEELIFEGVFKVQK